jgi:hypothetical protein
MINENDKIVEIVTHYPFLKGKLIDRNTRFRNLNNSPVYRPSKINISIKDSAKITGEDLEDLLQFLNNEILIYEDCT